MTYYGQNNISECLASTSIAVAPPPVVLEPSAPTGRSEFICRDRAPVFAFSCKTYGEELIWKFNETVVTSFHANDTVGNVSTVKVFSSAESAVYNVSAQLTKVVNLDSATNVVNSTYCVSILTVRPFNDSQFMVVPFNVTCQTHCQDGTLREVCKTNRYKTAGML